MYSFELWFPAIPYPSLEGLTGMLGKGQKPSLPRDPKIRHKSKIEVCLSHVTAWRYVGSGRRVALLHKNHPGTWSLQCCCSVMFCSVLHGESEFSPTSALQHVGRERENMEGKRYLFKQVMQKFHHPTCSHSTGKKLCHMPTPGCKGGWEGSL